MSDLLFYSIFLRKLPSASAADHAGWRYEYLKWAFLLGSARHYGPGATGNFIEDFIPGRGALALTALSRRLVEGRIPPSVRSWFLGGRFIALCKPGDVPDDR